MELVGKGYVKEEATPRILPSHETPDGLMMRVIVRGTATTLDLILSDHARTHIAKRTVHLTSATSDSIRRFRHTPTLMPASGCFG